MLVLRRMSGQSIVIGKNAEIIIKVLRNENGTVSIGVNAPQTIPVDRLEVLEKRLQGFRASNDAIASCNAPSS